MLFLFRFVCNFVRLSCLLELFRLLPDGTWDTSLSQASAASASGGAGGCLYRSEPLFQTTRPRFPVFVIPLHALCYGDVNRLIRIRLRHKDQTLAWIDLTLKEMVLACGKKVPLKPATAAAAAATNRVATAAAASTPTAAGTAASIPAAQSAATSSSSSSLSATERSVGVLLFKRVSVYSHLSELPTLCANAGIERRPVPGVSNLPLRSLIRAQEQLFRHDAKAVEGGAKATVNVVGSADSAALDEQQDEGVTGDDTEAGAAGIDGDGDGDAAADGDMVVALPVRRITRNVYRGLHHIRAKSAGKFFTSMLPVKQSLMEARQMAVLMASHPRLGADSVIGKHLLASPIFDPHLIPFIFTFLS